MSKKRGKWNLIDAVIVVIIVCICIGGYLYFKKDSGTVQNIMSGKEKLVFTAEAEEVLPEIIDSINIGDQLVATGKYQDAFIKDVQVYDQQYITAKDGKIISYNDTTLKRVVVTIEANVNRSGPYYELGGQEIKAGASYWIKTDKMHMNGFVVSVD